MSGHEYRDRIAGYVHRNFASFGLVVHTEIELGKTIIGKQRRIDVFILHERSAVALGLECKYQRTGGTTDEKIPYALADLDAMWIPGCLVYAGEGWSRGVLHTLEGSRNAVFCDPGESLERSKQTIELDHVLASVFGLWSQVIPSERRFAGEQLSLPVPGFARVTTPPVAARKPGRKSG